MKRKKRETTEGNNYQRKKVASIWKYWSGKHQTSRDERKK